MDKRKKKQSGLSKLAAKRNSDNEMGSSLASLREEPTARPRKSNNDTNNYRQSNKSSNNNQRDDWRGGEEQQYNKKNSYGNNSYNNSSSYNNRRDSGSPILSRSPTPDDSDTGWNNKTPQAKRRETNNKSINRSNSLTGSPISTPRNGSYRDKKGSNTRLDDDLSKNRTQKDRLNDSRSNTSLNRQWGGDTTSDYRDKKGSNTRLDDDLSSLRRQPKERLTEARSSTALNKPWETSDYLDRKGGGGTSKYDDDFATRRSTEKDRLTEARSSTSLNRTWENADYKRGGSSSTYDDDISRRPLNSQKDRLGGDSRSSTSLNRTFEFPPSYDLDDRKLTGSSARFGSGPPPLSSRGDEKKPIPKKRGGLNSDNESSSSDLLTFGKNRPQSNQSGSRRMQRLNEKMETIQHGNLRGSLPPSSRNIVSPDAASKISSASSISGSLRSLNIPQLKEKSFLVGSPWGSCGSMLGASELDALLPHRRLRLFVMTWNMHSPANDDYPKTWESLLFPDEVTEPAHAYVIALQEVPSNSQEVHLRIQETLGPCYLPFASEFFGSLGLCVFIHRDLIWYCSAQRKATLKTRAAITTKGAIGITFRVFGTSFLFLSTHLKSDVGKSSSRIEDYYKILHEIDLPSQQRKYDSSKENVREIVKDYDMTFWAGDLNFRITASKETVESITQAIDGQRALNYEKLLAIDELNLAQAEGKAFQAFQEGRINFRPTYKYDLNSDKYDTSDLNRIPAYTDRVLYYCRGRAAAACMHYNCINEVKTSDHRAVYSVFECELKPGRDSADISVGEFDRNIYLEGIRRRANHLDYSSKDTKKSNSRVCTIS